MRPDLRPPGMVVAMRARHLWAGPALLLNGSKPLQHSPWLVRAGAAPVAVAPRAWRGGGCRARSTLCSVLACLTGQSYLLAARIQLLSPSCRGFMLYTVRCCTRAVLQAGCSVIRQAEPLIHLLGGIAVLMRGKYM